MRCLPALVCTTLLIQLPSVMGVIADLDRIKEIWRRIVEFITLGRVALALLGGLVFLLTWVLSHLRRPSDRSRRWLSRTALGLAWLPVLLTGVAAAGLFGACSPAASRPRPKARSRAPCQAPAA